MIRRISFVVLLALSSTSAWCTASPASAQDDGGSIGIGLVDAPENRRDDPRAHTHIVDHLEQGATIVRHVQISSTVPGATSVQLYVAAATLAEGEFVFGEGRAGNDLTDWTHIDPPTVEVPSGGSVQAAVTIAVPTDATDGERYGVIWAELPGSGGSANVETRVGVRIYLSVGEGEEPVTDFTIDSLTARRDADGTAVVETTVTNTGGRAVDLAGSLQLTNGPGSLNAGPFAVQVGTTLAPGATAPAQVRLDQTLADGPWEVVVTIESGRETREATGSITFPSEPGATAEPVEATSSVKEQRKILIPIAAAAALLVGGAVVAYLVRSRRRMLQAKGKIVKH